MDAKGSASYSWRDLTVEAGGGWLYNRSLGKASSGPLLRDKVTVKAGFAQVSGRYRFTPRWEAGLSNRFLFAADTRMQTSQPIGNHLSWWFGPEGVYRFPFRFPLQISASFLTDATTTDRQVYQVLIGASVGFPVLPSPRTVESTPTPTPVPTATPTPEVLSLPVATPVPTPTPVVVTVAVPVPFRTYSFDLQPIQFDFGSDRIRPKSMPALKKLGKFLAEHRGGWEKLTVEGHTDRRGREEYNLRLSERRAESVRKVLIAQGVPESSVSAVGYGFSRPRVDKNTPEAWRKNRRVDFSLEKISEPEAFDTFFRELNREH